MASHPPNASTPSMPISGTAVSAGLYRAVSRTVRSRDANSSSLAASSRCISCSSWPNPLITRTPPMASSTIPATSPTCCCACQLAGNRRLREARAISQSAGTTAAATSVSGGDRKTMMMREKTNRNTLPMDSGIIDSTLWTMFRSEIERPTSCPVWISSCRAPSSLDSEPNSSVRMSCCTSRAILPPQYRRPKTPAKLTAAAISSPMASGHTDEWCPTMTSSMALFCSNGITRDAPVASSVPPTEIVTARGCLRQYPASRRTHRRSLGLPSRRGGLPYACGRLLAIRAHVHAEVITVP